MTEKMKPYRGYTATVEFDPDEMVLHGRLDHIRDAVSFQASSVDELQREFAAAVDDYLALCAERSEEPEKPYSGRFVVRIDPDLHRRVATAASRSGSSINSWIVDALRAQLDSGVPATDQGDALIERVAVAMRSLLAGQHRATRRGAAFRVSLPAKSARRKQPQAAKPKSGSPAGRGSERAKWPRSE